MKCTDNKCQYIEYLKNIPFIEFCRLTAENKLRCDVCNMSIDANTVIDYLEGELNNDKLCKNK